MKNLSMVTTLLLFSSSVTFADTNSISEALTSGKTTGAFDIYTTSTNGKSGVTDSGYTSGGLTLSYETANYNGLSGKVTFLGVGKIDEKSNGDFKNKIASNSILSEANITYSQDLFSFTVGRQEIDLEWLADYNEGVVLTTTAIPNSTLVLAYVDKRAVAKIDEVSSKFSEANGSSGLYVIDGKYAVSDSLELNPYYYTTPNVANFYGLKASYSTDLYGIVAQYAKSNEKVSGTKDGSVFNAELSTVLNGVTLIGGYIKTDKKGGAGSISSFNDNISPFEEGNYIYAGASTSVNEETYYASIAYVIKDIELSALYGKTKYDTSTTKGENEKELDLSASYSFTNELSASLLYVDVKANSSTNDYNKVVATLTYSF